ncbi:hypothetical protein M3Y97_00529800 [Aphelenchoides bicaudatus]|nr:hypothetical protein M3Y97_00529800 [Aphelenchoides bicaudatus]
MLAFLCRNSALWILCVPLSVVLLTVSFMLILTHNLPEIEFQPRLYEGGLNITSTLEAYYDCLNYKNKSECIKDSWSVPLQLEIAYIKILSTLNISQEFLNCSQDFYEHQVNSTAKFAVQTMSNKINNFKNIYLNPDFYCTYVNLIEQPLFCSLQTECAKTNHDRIFLQTHYARRYIRVLMAQSDGRNQPFGINEPPGINQPHATNQMLVCEQIAFPHLVKKYAEATDKDYLTPTIIPPNVEDAKLKILNIDLCLCEFCNASARNLSTIVLTFVLINLFH